MRFYLHLTLGFVVLIQELVFQVFSDQCDIRIVHVIIHYLHFKIIG